MRPIICHVAQIRINEQSGMGRVAWHWKNEFERRGYDFIHIGPEQVGPLRHPALFPHAAYRAYRNLDRPADLILAHEPSSGVFIRDASPTVVFSHGIERRGWQLALQGRDGTNEKIRWRTKILFPLWRLRQCDLGLRKAAKLLLINDEDAVFARNYYRRSDSQICVFKNGAYPSKLNEEAQPCHMLTGLFLGSWLERKGINTLVEAARILDERGARVNWLLAGTGLDRDAVLSRWPDSLRTAVEVIPEFTPDAEDSIFARSSFFVLPSFFEGQPLALLQAMESARCCITTNCCGQRDLIRHGYNGLLHEPGDAQHLASLIEQCINSETLRKGLGRAAKQAVQGRRWEAVSSEMADFVESAFPLAKGAGAR
ncbi:MAG TPA: glycosyltransferase family 4 protein [Blastocatellia bacterium]